LIELLVALMIFAMLSLAGVALLRGSVSAQGQVRDHLDRLADIQVAVSALDADLQQATVRISRTQAGTLAPAFFAAGEADREDKEERKPLLQFVRMGWTNPDGVARPSVQKVEYWWREGRLERVSYPQLDGAAPSEPSVLLNDVSGLAFRFRNAQGEWSLSWHPEQADRLPVLVEMQVTRRDRPPVTVCFLVGPGSGQEQEPQAESEPKIPEAEAANAT
jgi:general secretion pathway protein J